MKISVVTAALAATVLPFALGQSSAPSAALPLESIVPTGPTESGILEIDPACSAHPLCLAEDLADDCCPTIEDVFLDCCDLGEAFLPPAPTPSEPSALEPTVAALDTSSMPSSETAAVDTSSMPSSESIFVSFVPTGGDTSMPTAGINSTAVPLGIDEEGPDAQVVVLTPTSYSGCIKVNGDGNEDDDFRLAFCDASDEKEQFKFVGNQIQLAMDDTMCMQAGRNAEPEDGKYLRVFKCDSNESLQRFTWDAPDGALTLVDYPDFAVVFRGVNANVNSDPIILGDLNKSEVFKRMGWTIF